MLERSQLIDAYFDEGLSAREFGTLQTWLRESPDHARQFMCAAFVHDRLRTLLRSESLEATEEGVVLAANIQEMLAEIETSLAAHRASRESRAAEVPTPNEQKQSGDSRQVANRANWFTYVAPSIVVAIVLLIVLLRLPRQPTGLNPVATIRKSCDARWVNQAVSSAPGTALLAGPLELLEGVVEISFAEGASVLVEGPARLDLQSTRSVKLLRGRLVGQVPHGATGFRVDCPGVMVTDLGTEFGTAVAADGSTAVQVLTGIVELAVPRAVGGDAPAAPLRVGAGSARSVKATGGPIQTIPFDFSPFLRRVPNTSYELAVAQSRPMCFWRFSPSPTGLAIEDLGWLAVQIPVSDGRDRFRPLAGAGERGNTALALRGGEDGITVGPQQQLRFAAGFSIEAWAVVEGAVKNPQRFLSSFGGSERTGQSGFAMGVVDGHWFGRPEFDVAPLFSLHGVADIAWPIAVGSGRIHHYVVTLDAQGVPLLMVDGQRAPQPLVRTVGGNGGWAPTAEGQSVGRAVPSDTNLMIGRNPPGDVTVPPEAWNGLVDELAIYDRPLPESEIEAHYRAVERDRAAGR
jgi:Concanavalin A-like lectin/glucanases superfamily/FecR protein